MPEFGFLSDSSGFLGFGWRETETDLLELVFGGEDPLPTAGVVGLAGVGSDMVGFLGWGGLGLQMGVDSPRHKGGYLLFQAHFKNSI